MNEMAMYGRGGDSMVGHLSRGDLVIPRDVVLSNPEFLVKFKKAMEEQGGDYRTHIAGSGFENVNPHTGSPEFFFNSIFKAAKNIFKPVFGLAENLAGPVIGGTAGFFTGGPVGAILGAAGGANLNKGGGGNAAPASTAAPPADIAPEPAFTPKKPELGAAPTPDLASLNPLQQRTSIASRGLYGGGVSDEERDYYLKSLQRNIVDDSGQVGSLDDVTPVERTYLTKLGYPTDSAMSFLKAIQR